MNKFKHTICALTAFGVIAFTGNTHAQLYKLDQPAVDEVTLKFDDSISVQASEIEVVNLYKDNKYSGDYSKNFAVMPDVALANYIEKRFEASDDTAPKLFFVIDKASVIFNRDVQGYNGSKQDKYSVEYRTRLVYGDSLEKPLREKRVKMTGQLTQVPDILTKQQRADGQIQFVANLIEQFDARVQKKL